MGDTEKGPETNELADALVGAVTAGRAVREAARRRVLTHALRANATAGRILSALWD
jgi:hypothetical protein